MELQNLSSAGMVQYFKRQNRRNAQQQHTQTNANSNVSERSNSSTETESSRDHPFSGSRREAFCDDLNIITGPVRLSQFATIDTRTRTFTKWRKKNVCVKKMVEAGFVYTLKDDIVECFHCGGVLRDWPDFSDPWEQHALAFPKCPHVRRCRGDKYINSIRTKSIASNANKVNNFGFSVVDVIKGSPRSTENVTDAIQEAFNIEKSLDTLTVDSLSRTLTEIYNEARNDHDDTDSFENDSDLDEGEFENIEKIEEENRRLKDPVTCKICFDAIANIVTLPCGHMVSCVQCIPALKSCAVCRTPIKGTVRAVMAVNHSNEKHVSRG